MANVTLQYFASIRDAQGRGHQTLFVEDGACVRDVVRGVVAQRLLGGVRYAVNDRFVPSDHVLEDGDVVAVMPPFGGG